MKFIPRILICLVVVPLYSCKPLGQKESTPNIIILLADDMGYSDLGCYGGIANTPNLDQLANEGIRFTDFYSAAPNCSPARAGLLTGRDPAKSGIYNYIPTGHPMHLRSDEITLAEIAKQAGYQTAHFGKWHLSTLTADRDLGQPQPSDQGFDYSFGTTNNVQPSHLNPINFIRNGEKVGPIEGYSCDILVSEAIDWMNQIEAAHNPFFLYLAFNEPHKKVASPPELVTKYDTFPPLHAEYLANIENLDKAIGVFLERLKLLNHFDNTLILFASDNGSYRNGSNDPLLGGKSFVYEGGIRVPGIIHWNNHIVGGQENSTPVGLIDIMPTLCNILDIAHPSISDLDGTDINPIFAGQLFDRTRPMSWFFYRTTPEIAMRIGNHVLLGSSDDTIRLTHPTTQPSMDHIMDMQLNSFEIYNLQEDPSQETNVYNLVKDTAEYKNMLKARLLEIQQEGPYWENLPKADMTKKRKHEWRALRPTAFSN